MSRAAALALVVPLLAPSADAATPLRVWCLGDSIVRFYARELARLEPTWDVVDVGVGGERSDQGRERLETLLGERPAPDVAVIIFGANDVVAGGMRGEAGIGPETAAANIRAMAAQLRAAGVLPIIALPVGAPPVRPDDPRSARLTLVALRRGFAELRKLLHAEHPHVDFRLTRHERFIDAVHPSPSGAAIIAARARAAIRRARANDSAAVPARRWD
jgi:lysophospholipase L1-like esterase